MLMTLLIGAAAFFVLRHFFGTGIGVAGGALSVVTLQSLARYTDSTGLVHSAFKTYFVGRQRGMNETEALCSVIHERYRSSPKERDYLLGLYLPHLLDMERRGLLPHRQDMGIHALITEMLHVDNPRLYPREADFDHPRSPLNVARMIWEVRWAMEAGKHGELEAALAKHFRREPDPESWGL